MASAGKAPIKQPPFDPRILNLSSPLGGSSGNIERGIMIWDGPITGYNNSAMLNFLYNPSTVTADYYMAPDSSVTASLLFPTAYNSTQLRVPLNQSVTWSLLFDRTYELWGSYNSSGSPIYTNNAAGNDPRVVGVLADIIQMQQFTGMLTGYSTASNSGGTTTPTSTSYTSLGGYQGVLQLIPSYVFFGSFLGGTSVSYYGYISEWDVTITHWTQFMVPMRCVINITMTMMPHSATPSSGSSNSQWSTSSTGITSSNPNAATGGTQKLGGHT